MFIFLSACSLLVPLSMIILGYTWKDKPPKDRQGSSGYRTTMSRMNDETWRYAHRCWGFKIKEKKYIDTLNHYRGNLLLVGINYDKITKEHTCVIEKEYKVGIGFLWIFQTFIIKDESLSGSWIK